MQTWMSLCFEYQQIKFCIFHNTTESVIISLWIRPEIQEKLSEWGDDTVPIPILINVHVDNIFSFMKSNNLSSEIVKKVVY